MFPRGGGEAGREKKLRDNAAGCKRDESQQKLALTSLLSQISAGHYGFAFGTYQFCSAPGMWLMCLEYVAHVFGEVGGNAQLEDCAITTVVCFSDISLLEPSNSSSTSCLFGGTSWNVEVMLADGINNQQTETLATAYRLCTTNKATPHIPVFNQPTLLQSQQYHASTFFALRSIHKRKLRQRPSRPNLCHALAPAACAAFGPWSGVGPMGPRSQSGRAAAEESGTKCGVGGWGAGGRCGSASATRGARTFFCLGVHLRRTCVHWTGGGGYHRHRGDDGCLRPESVGCRRCNSEFQQTT